jgi:two-component system response regulator NreC
LPKILLVDDHAIVRKGIRELLDSRWEICGEADNGEEAVQKALELKPDLILMDISMPRVNGIEATKRIRKLSLPAKIIILSMHDSGEIAQFAKEAGADACLVKTCVIEDLLTAITTLLSGHQTDKNGPSQLPRIKPS